MIYQNTNHCKKVSKTRRLESESDKQAINWENPRNVIIGFVVVVIILFLIGEFVAKYNTSPYNKTMREYILENHDFRDGPIDCTGINSQSAECIYLLNLPHDSSDVFYPY